MLRTRNMVLWAAFIHLWAGMALAVPESPSADIQLTIETESATVLSYQPLHLCIWATNVSERTISISYNAFPAIYFKPEGGRWEKVRSPSQSPVPTPPPPDTANLIPGATVFWPHLVHFTRTQVPVVRGEAETDASFHFRERCRPVFSKAGKCWLRAEWRFSEKEDEHGNKKRAFSIVSEPVAVMVVEGADADRQALDTLKKTPEIMQYFSDLADVRLPLSDVAQRNAQAMLVKHGDSIFAGYTRFALATHERLAGKPDWRLRAEQQYKAIRDGKDQRLKGAALLRLAELAAPDNPALALQYCEQLHDKKANCYVRARALGLRKTLQQSTASRSRKRSAVLAQPLNQLDTRVSFSGRKITIRNALALLQQKAKASVIDPIESEYAIDGSDSGPVMFCREMPIAYLLSWFEHYLDLQYDLTDDKGQVDNNGRKALRVLFEEKQGTWYNAVNAALQRKATCGFTESDLPSAIRILAETAEVSFIIDPKVLGPRNTVPKVSGRYTNERLSSILDDLLKPTEMTYRLQGQAVYIFSK